MKTKHWFLLFLIFTLWPFVLLSYIISMIKTAVVVGWNAANATIDRL